MTVRIKITVENQSRYPRSKEPVNVGIPLSRDLKIKAAAGFSLADADGRNVPCQAVPLAWWPGTEDVSWVLVHFQADVPSFSSKDYYIKINTQPQPAAAQQDNLISHEQNTLRVNTGAVRFAAGDITVGSLFAEILKGADADCVGPRLKTKLGTVLKPGRPTKFIVDENGSEKAVVKLEGPYLDAELTESGFTYVIRVEFYRNRPYCRVFNTIIADQTGELADASFVIPKAGIGRVYSESGELLLEEESGAGLLQDQHDQIRLVTGSEGENRNCRFQGWIGDDKSAAAVRFFWQMFPKSIEIEDVVIKLGLLPEQSQWKDSFRLTDDIVTSYSFAEGEARTHELLLVFDAAAKAYQELASIFAGLHTPLTAAASYEWYVSSGFFGDLTVHSDDHCPEFESLVNQSLEMILNRREELGLYGDRNFGDDLMNKSFIWNNCEYDYPHAGILQFVRGAGTRWYTEFALPAARHLYNIDFVNAGAYAGYIYPHSHRHNTAAPKLGSHSWLQGMLEYFLISGDYRARDLAQLVGERWCSLVLEQDEIGGTERAVTWPLIAMLALYQVFGDEKYLDAAVKIRNRVVELFDFELGHFEGCMKRENYPPSYWQVFLIGSPVLESLVMYYQLTGDELIKAIIIAIAERLAQINWIEAIGEWEYTRTNGMRNYHTPKNNRMVSPGVGYAYLYSGNQDLWDKAVTAFKNSCNDLDDQGKEMTQSLRFGVRMPALMGMVEKSREGKLS